MTNPYESLSSPASDDGIGQSSRTWYSRRSIRSPFLRLGLAIVALFVGGVVGLFVGFIFGAIFAGLAGIPDMEGASGYAALVISFAGGHILGWGLFLYVLLYWTREKGWGLKSG